MPPEKIKDWSLERRQEAILKCLRETCRWGEGQLLSYILDWFTGCLWTSDDWDAMYTAAKILRRQGILTFHNRLVNSYGLSATAWLKYTRKEQLADV